jgi:hypothetical protein
MPQIRPKCFGSIVGAATEKKRKSEQQHKVNNQTK